MNPRRPPSLLRQTLALEPRMLLDAAALTTAMDVAAETAPPTDTAPGLQATPAEASLVITDTTDAIPPIDLFSDVTVYQETGGTDALAELVIRVDRTGANQALAIDGKLVVLTGGDGFTRQTDGAPDGYAYGVQVSGSTTTLTIHLNAFADDTGDVQALVDGLAYHALDNTVPGGTVTVTLVSLSDEGGQTTDLSPIRATIDIDSQINVPPTLSGKPLVQAESLSAGHLAGATELAYAVDARHVYVAGANDTVTVFAVDGASGQLTQTQVLIIENLGTVRHMVTSADGRSVYTLSSNGSLVHLDVADDGSLALASAHSVGTGANGGMAISHDGLQLYVDASNTSQREVHVYGRDRMTGALTHTQTLEGIRNASIATSGNTVYVIHSGAAAFLKHSLKVYERGADARLTLVDEIAELPEVGMDPVGYALATSADGRLLYVGNPQDSGIAVYRLGEDRRLSLVSVAPGERVSSLAFNTDHTQLFAASGDGSIRMYAVTADGTLALEGQIQGSPAGRNLAVAPDGLSVLVAGQGLSRYSAVQTLVPGTPLALAGALTLSDANFDLLAGGEGEYGGGRLTITRTDGVSTHDVLGFAEANGLRLENGHVYKAGQPIAAFAAQAGTLTVTFLPGTSRDDANAILRQIVYDNTDTQDLGRTVTLSVVANDSQADSQVVTLDVLITRNTPPAVDASPVADTRYDTAGTTLPLFHDVIVNPGEAGQRLVEFVFTVQGLDDTSGDWVIINGVRVNLSEASQTHVDGLDYGYTRSGTSGVLTVRSATGLSVADAQSVIGSVAYLNESETAVTGQRVITLSSVRDDGGNAGGGSDTGEPGIQAHVELALNRPPQWQAQVTHPDPTLYYSDGTLTGYDGYVTDVLLSANGELLLVSGSSRSSGAGAGTLHVFARDPMTGALAHLQTFSQDTTDEPAAHVIQVAGLGVVTAVAMHGDTVYVAGGGSGAHSLIVFVRDATDGGLRYGGVVATQGVDGVDGLQAPISDIVLSADGRSLYTVNGVDANDYPRGATGLTQFSRDAATGALTFLGVHHGNDSLPMNAPSRLAISADGRSVYVANRSTQGGLTVFSRDDDTGLLTYAGRINDASISADPDSGPRPEDNRYLQNLQDVVVSHDDTYVYTGSGTQSTVSIFRRDAATGDLTYVGTVDLYAQGLTPGGALSVRELALSADGAVLYVGVAFNEALLAFNRDAASGTLHFAERIAMDGALTTRVAVSADGRNIYGGHSMQAGLAIATALPNVRYDPAAPATPFADAGVAFSDPDFDARASYQGGVLTIARADGANGNGHYGFADGQGLRLDNGRILQGDVAIADFLVNAGTLTITFTGALDQATANQVLSQVSYQDEHGAPPARTDLVVTISDGTKQASVRVVLLDDTQSGPGNAPPFANGDAPTLPPATVGVDYTFELPDTLFVDPDNDRLAWEVSGLPWGMSFDPDTRRLSGVPMIAGGATLTITVRDPGGATASRTLMLEVADTGDPEVPVADTPEPQLEATGVQASAHIGPDGSQTIDLFDGVSVLLGRDAHDLDRLFITIDTDGTNQALIVDGQVVPLTPTSGFGETADNAFSYEVDVMDGQTVVTVWLFFKSPADVVSLVDNLRYQALDDSVAAGAVTVTLSRLSDEGYNEARPGIAAIIELTRDTDSGGGELTFPDIDLANVDSARLTLDAVLAEANARATSLSPDDTHLYVLASDAQGYGVLQVYRRDTASGALTLAEGLGLSSDALNDGTSVAVSADGRLVFVAGNAGNNILVYARDAATGALTQTAILDASTHAELAGITELAVSADGLSLYATTQAGAVLALQRNPADDSLRVVGSYTPEWDNARSVTVSADGKAVYVTQYGGWRIYAYTRDPATGTLSESRESSNTAGNQVMDAAITPDGRFLYTVNFNMGSSHIVIYGVAADGAMVEVGTVPVGLSLTDVAVSADGKAVYALSGAGGNTLLVYGRDADTGLLTKTGRFQNEAFGSTNAGVANITVSADGRSVYVASADTGALVVLTARDAGAPAVIVIDLEPANDSYVIGADPLRLIEAGTITGEGGSPLPGYGGATLTVAREDGAHPEDTFSFLGDTWTYDADSGEIRQGDDAVATVDATPGQWTIRFGANATADTVAAVLGRIGYANTGSGGQTVSLAITYTAADGSRGTATTSVEVQPAEAVNRPPEDSGLALAPEAGRVGEAYRLVLPAGLFVDPDGDTLTWDVEGLPPGLAFDPDTLTVSGTPATAGSYILTLSATDPASLRASRTVTLTVTEAATNPGTGPGTEPGTGPGTNPGTGPGTEPGTGPGTNPGTGPGTNPGTGPGTEPGTGPGTNPGTGPGTNPGTGPGTEPGTGPGTNPGTGPGTNPGTGPGTEPGTGPGTNPGTGPGTEPGTGPGTNPGTGPGTEPGTGPGTNPGTGPGTEPGTGPGTEPGTGPGTNPGTGPGTNPGTGPGTNPGTGPGTEPGTGPGTNPGTGPGTEPSTGPGTTPGANPEPGAMPPPAPPPQVLAFPWLAGSAMADAPPRLDEPAPAALTPPPAVPPGSEPPRPPAAALPSSAALLDALLADSLAREQAAAPDGLPLTSADGRASPLVVLASPDAPGLSAASAAVTGILRYDPAGQRQVFALPAGLVRSSHAIAALDLRMADGRALPAGVRLDRATGEIVVSGRHRALALTLVVRDTEGATLRVPVTLSTDARAAWPAPASSPDTEPTAPTPGKAALSEQLRQSAAHDLLAQARQFLAELDVPAEPANAGAQAPAGARQPSSPIAQG